MEKISRILPSSPRFYVSEKSRSQPARPGAIELGRASKEEAEAAKISVSQLAREILRASQDEKQINQLPSQDVQIEAPKATEPLTPVKNRDVQESSSEKSPAESAGPQGFFLQPQRSPETTGSVVE